MLVERVKAVSDEIGRLKDRLYRSAGLNCEEHRIIAQRVHELQQIKRSMTNPESFLQPKKEFVTEDRTQAVNRLERHRNKQLLLLLEI